MGSQSMAAYHKWHGLPLCGTWQIRAEAGNTTAGRTGSRKRATDWIAEEDWSGTQAEWEAFPVASLPKRLAPTELYDIIAYNSNGPHLIPQKILPNPVLLRFHMRIWDLVYLDDSMDKKKTSMTIQVTRKWKLVEREEIIFYLDDCFY